VCDDFLFYGVVLAVIPAVAVWFCGNRKKYEGCCIKIVDNS